MELSVIIVSFNTKDILKNCLESVYKFAKNIEFEVIVVDNLSTDGSREMLKSFSKKYKNFDLIENKKNEGFAVANNLGIKKSRGRYVLLLNSDTLLIENSFYKIRSFMESHPKCGISTVRLLNKDKSEQATGGSFPTILRIFLWATFLDDLPFIDRLVSSYHPHTSNFYTNNNYYGNAHKQDWVTGAVFMIRKEVIEQVNGFDPDFYMYVEELEFCYRAKKQGWEIWYTPDTEIIHLGGASSPNRINAVLGEFKGLRLFYAKHFSYWKQFILTVLLKKAAILRIIVFGLIKGDKNSLLAYSKALTL